MSVDFLSIVIALVQTAFAFSLCISHSFTIPDIESETATTLSTVTACPPQ